MHLTIAAVLASRRDFPAGVHKLGTNRKPTGCADVQLMPPWGVAGARKSTCCSASVVPRSCNFTGGKRHQTDITSVVHSQAENADTPAPFVPSVQAIESGVCMLLSDGGVD